jgi:hypothetical protein
MHARRQTTIRRARIPAILLTCAGTMRAASHFVYHFIIANTFSACTHSSHGDFFADDAAMTDLKRPQLLFSLFSRRRPLICARSLPRHAADPRRALQKRTEITMQKHTAPKPERRRLIVRGDDERAEREVSFLSLL